MGTPIRFPKLGIDRLKELYAWAGDARQGTVLKVGTDVYVSTLKELIEHKENDIKLRTRCPNCDFMTPNLESEGRDGG